MTNATGVALLLSLIQQLADSGWRGERTLRLVAFSTEEPPFTRTRRMGSLVYARELQRRNERVLAMLSLECLGRYAGARDSLYCVAPPWSRSAPDPTSHRPGSHGHGWQWGRADLQEMHGV